MVNDRVPDLYRRLCSAHVRDPDRHPCSGSAHDREGVAAVHSCHAASVPEHAAVAPVAYAVPHPAAACDPGLPGHAAEAELLFGCFHHPVAPELNVEAPSASGFAPEVLPADPAERVRTIVVPPSAGNAGESPCHAAGNGNSGCAVYAAVPRRDTGLLHTRADRWDAVHAPELNCGSTYPILFDAVPIHGPSAAPSVAAHLNTIRESTQEADGNSEPARAE